MLTRKQYELLDFLHQQIDRTGVPPSFDEMKAALGLHSKSGVHRLVTALEERGFIRRLHSRARAIEVIKLADNQPPNDQLALAQKTIKYLVEENNSLRALLRRSAPQYVRAG